MKSNFTRVPTIFGVALLLGLVLFQCGTKQNPEPTYIHDTINNTIIDTIIVRDTIRHTDTVIVVIPETREFIRGADLSFLPEIRQSGALFYDSLGNVKDALQIFKENGCNTVRLRLWHNPSSGHSTLAEVQAFAQEIKAKGMKVLLDFHYSDTWTDPGQQAKPSAWAALADAALGDSVYQYTKRVVSLIQPDYVQIGNEINGGMLWENGRLSKQDAFVGFLKKGVQAVREVLPQTKIIIHFAGINNSDYFYNVLKTKGLDYDIIGLSFYPVFHGKDLNALTTTMSQLVSKYGKKCMLAEMAYPFTLGWADNTNNTVGLSSQLVTGYPATAEGQKQYLLKLRQIVTDNEKGFGFCYWAPDWIAFKGPTSTTGSNAENQALFNFNHKALPAMQFYRQ